MNRKILLTAAVRASKLVTQAVICWNSGWDNEKVVPDQRFYISS